MYVSRTTTTDELCITDPPGFGARLLGAIFLGFGAVVLVLIVMDAVKKLAGGDATAIPHAMISTLIVLIMAGLPGILFGFQTNHIRLNQDQDEFETTKNFVLFRRTSRKTCRDLFGVRLKRRTDTSRSRIGNSSQYRTRTVHYVDIVLVGPSGRQEVVGSVHENQQNQACEVAREIADYLNITFENKDEFCSEHT